MEDDAKRLEAEAVALRRVAFFGVAISTVATLVCVISVPLLYNYMQHMQSVMQSEVDFCKSRSSNIWREVTRTQGPTNYLPKLTTPSTSGIPSWFSRRAINLQLAQPDPKLMIHNRLQLRPDMRISDRRDKPERSVML
ncbi:unnamed protein product [Nippostrongylus brasiliensis]|uniref:Col_cuticle_N domain-containing protein n=1 Tax=Nippostrongylus brasiliensis TaxID=27835 RepID=A0A0N4XX86_NIPBR|nr:unnamed protein product [Nippostrongylus brasiliensis]